MQQGGTHWLDLLVLDLVFPGIGGGATGERGDHTFCAEGTVTTSRPRAFDSYRHWSAILRSSSDVVPCSGNAATPAESESGPRISFLYRNFSRFTSARSASARTAASCEVDSGMMIANSSPPKRQHISVERKNVRNRSARDCSTMSPAS